MIMQLSPPSQVRELPPGPIMEACERIGFLESQDVAWSKVSKLLDDRSGWFGRLLTRLMATGPMPSRRHEVACMCGEHFVLLLKYRFTLDTGEKIDYRIGQCERCRTIHWDNG
jgi:hypothetical protein